MDNDSRPIRLVTFDLYDTLIELVPTRWARLSQVLSQRGLEHDLDVLKANDLIAEDYWTEINTIQPIRDRDTDVQDEIRIEQARFHERPDHGRRRGVRMQVDGHIERFGGFQHGLELRLVQVVTLDV